MKVITGFPSQWHFFLLKLIIRCVCLCFRAQLTNDKGGVEITSDPKATKGKVMFITKELGKLSVVKFHIVNRGESCVYLTYYTALHKMRCFTLVDKRRVNRVSPLLLCPGEKNFETII